MTKEYLISANHIANMDRYTTEYLPDGAETLTTSPGDSTVRYSTIKRPTDHE